MNTRDSFRSHETKVDNREDRLSHGIGVAILPYFSNPPPPRSSGRRGKSEADGQDAKNKTWPHNSTDRFGHVAFKPVRLNELAAMIRDRLSPWPEHARVEKDKAAMMAKEFSNSPPIR